MIVCTAYDVRSKGFDSPASDIANLNIESEIK